MPAPTPEDVRSLIVRAYAKGTMTYEEVADMFAVGRATVSRVLALHRETESVAPKLPAGGPKPRLGLEARAEMAKLVDTHPDYTIERLAAEWAAAHPELAVSEATVGRVIRGLGYTIKKNSFDRRKSNATTSRTREKRSRRG